jgi:hypothetical protein
MRWRGVRRCARSEGLLETAKGDVFDELRALCGEDTIALLGTVLALAVGVAVVAGEVLPGALVDFVRLFAGDAAFDAFLVDEAGSAAGHIRRCEHHQGGAQKRKSLLDTGRQMVSNASRHITMRWLTLIERDNVFLLAETSSCE